jgi:hypothetical protein
LFPSSFFIRDPTKWCILAWSYLGWAYDLHTTSENEIRQAQARTLELDAAEARAQAVWPTEVEKLPKWTEQRWMEEARKEKGRRIYIKISQYERSKGSSRKSNRARAADFRVSPFLSSSDEFILDVTSFSDHPGGSAILRRSHGTDVTADFSGVINQHTEAAWMRAMMFRIAVVGPTQ